MTLALWSVFFPSGPDEQTGIRNHHLETRVNIPRLAAAGARSCPSPSVCRKLGAWVRRSWELRFLFPEEPTLCFSCRSFHWLPLLSANCWQLPSEHVENSEPFLLMNPLSRRPTQCGCVVVFGQVISGNPFSLVPHPQVGLDHSAQNFSSGGSRLPR